MCIFNVFKRVFTVFIVVFSELKTNDWVIISLCHHTVCTRCLKTSEKNVCPVCKILFNPQLHVSSVDHMRIAFCQVGEIILELQSLE